MVADSSNHPDPEKSGSPVVFISYGSGNEEMLNVFQQYITDKGFVPHFIPPHNRESLESAKSSTHSRTMSNKVQEWRNEIKWLIDDSDVVVVLLTPQAASSTWVLSEIVWGIACGKEPVIVRQKGVDLPMQLTDMQIAAEIEESVLTERAMSAIATKIYDIYMSSAQKKRGITSDSSELYESVLDVHIRNHANPNIDTIRQLLRHPPQKLDEKLLVTIIKQQIKDRGASLRQITGPQFKLAHEEQWRLGNLLGQIGDSTEYHAKLSGELHVEGHTIRAYQYPVTVGQYRQCNPSFQSNNYNNVPWTWTLHFDDRGDTNTDDLINDIQQLAAVLTGLQAGAKKGQVRLPTKGEWQALAAPNSHALWTDQQVIRACNVGSARVKPKIAAVESYPISTSKEECYDVIGNVWEICLDSIKGPDTLEQSDLWVAGWCHKSEATLVAASWDRFYTLVGGMPFGEPVGIRFVIDYGKTQAT